MREEYLIVAKPLAFPTLYEYMRDFGEIPFKSN